MELDLDHDVLILSLFHYLGGIVEKEALELFALRIKESPSDFILIAGEAIVSDLTSKTLKMFVDSHKINKEVG